MPPKNLRTTVAPQQTKEDIAQSTQQGTKGSQQFHPTAPMPAHQHPPQSYQSMSHSQAPHTFTMDYPYSSVMPMGGAGPSRPMSYTQPNSMGNVASSSNSGNVGYAAQGMPMSQKHSMTSASSSQSRSDQTPMTSVSMGSGPMGMHQPSHPQLQHMQQAMVARGDMRQAMPNRPASVANSITSMHMQQAPPQQMQQQQQQPRIIHQMPGVPHMVGSANSASIQQQQQDSYYDARLSQNRMQQHPSYPPSAHSSATRQQMVSSQQQYPQSNSSSQPMMPHNAVASSIVTTPRVMGSATGPGSVSGSISAMHNSAHSPQGPDVSVPAPRFSAAYDAETIEQRITGYYSKQTSDFSSLIKLIQDSSADYSCVFSDSLVADLIGASSLNSPSQGHLRTIGLTLQHLLTCVLEKAREIALETNPEGASVLTDKDVQNALIALGFTSIIV